jgi:hypothetical protein
MVLPLNAVLVLTILAAAPPAGAQVAFTEFLIDENSSGNASLQAFDVTPTATWTSSAL